VGFRFAICERQRRSPPRTLPPFVRCERPTLDLRDARNRANAAARVRAVATLDSPSPPGSRSGHRASRAEMGDGLRSTLPLGPVDRRMAPGLDVDRRPGVDELVDQVEALVDCRGAVVGEQTAQASTSPLSTAARTPSEATRAEATESGRDRGRLPRRWPDARGPKGALRRDTVSQLEDMAARVLLALWRSTLSRRVPSPSRPASWREPGPARCG
jgi:hypothetical protein